MVRSRCRLPALSFRSAAPSRLLAPLTEWADTSTQCRPRLVPEVICHAIAHLRVNISGAPLLMRVDNGAGWKLFPDCACGNHQWPTWRSCLRHSRTFVEGLHAWIEHAGAVWDPIGNESTPLTDYLGKPEAR